MIIKKKNILFLTIALLFLPFVASAQPIDVQAIINRIANIAWTIFGGLVIIMFIYAGILYLTARGEPAKISQANKAVLWALVGTAVGVLAVFAQSIVSWLLF